MSLSIQAGRRSVRPGVAQQRVMGDPGLGGFIKGIGRAAVGFVTGGVGGAVGSVARDLNNRGQRRTAPQPFQGGSPFPTRPSVINPPFGGQPGVGLAVPGGGRFSFREDLQVAGSKLACPSGYHPNKSDYFLKDGTFVPEGTRCVKNRRRNAMNPRALDRAMGRLNSAKRVQAKLAEYSTGKYTATGKKKEC